MSHNSLIGETPIKHIMCELSLHFFVDSQGLLKYPVSIESHEGIDGYYTESESGGLTHEERTDSKFW